MQSRRPAAEFESSTVLKATTRLVIIDVVASDAQGNAVRDLKPNDFTVLEDGRPQNIRAFGFQHPVPRSADAVGRKLPVNVFTNIPLFQQTSALNVVLLDALNTSLPNQAYARQQMIKYLEKIPTDQPIAVYTLGTKLRMLQDFISDPNILKEVVKNYKGQASPLLESPAGGPDVEMYPPGLSADLIQLLEQFEAERISSQTDYRVRLTMEALQALAKSLSGYPGRKNLIWISEAFPLTIFPDSSLGLGAFSVQRNYDQEVLKTANTLIDSQVAIYPVDARGLVTFGFSAADSGRDKFGRNRTGGAAFAQDLSRQSSALYAVHSTMDDLAQRTGGKAYYNRNDIDGAIRNGIDDGSTYYMIGYYPDNKDWNGSFRKIQLKVDRPGIKLRHRLGYYAVDPQGYGKEDAKKRARDLGNALSLDTPISTALLFEAGVLPPSAQTADKVIVNYAIDAHALAFERGQDGLEHAEVECVVQAYSEKAKPLKSEGTTVSTSLKPETFRRVLERGFPCSRDIALPTGNYFLRLAVRDDRTGLMGTANARVTVPELPTNPVLIRRDQKKPQEKRPDDKKPQPF